MTKAKHSGRLTPSDASFLYLERKHAPMHIGALCILDGVVPFEEYSASVAVKLVRLPRFREKIVPTPFYIGHPTWETDPDFDIRNHIILHHIDGAGDPEELDELVGELIAELLDRNRPLWELHIIHGLPDGKSAIVSKVHHAMVDGVGGNEILTTILDIDREPPPPVSDNYEATGGLDPGARIVEALWDNTRSSIDAWSGYFRAMTDMGRSYNAEQARTTVAVLSELMPDLALPPRRLPFNAPCTGKRRISRTEFSFAEARAIRGTLGGTVNDVVLASLAGAVAKYARLHGEKTAGRSLRVMVPVNLRPEGDKAALGNLVSVLPVSLPLGIDDPVERLRAIRGITRALKSARVAENISSMANMMGVVPAPLQAAFGAMAVTPFPLYNIVCTNVPGPQIPLYALGIPLESYTPYIPVGFEMGVGCAIFSYNQKLFVGFSADLNACPDVDRLRDSMQEAFGELKLAAGVGEIAAVATSVRRRAAEVVETAPATVNTTRPAKPHRKTKKGKSGARKKAAAKPMNKRAGAKKATARQAVTEASAGGTVSSKKARSESTGGSRRSASSRVAVDKEMTGPN